MNVINLGQYASSLAVSNKRRYLEKIACISVDPYTIPISELREDTLPPIQCTDIFNYLVLGTSFCTSQKFNAFKSLEAYKYFESGFVMSVDGKVIGNKFVTLGKVSYTELQY